MKISKKEDYGVILISELGKNYGKGFLSLSEIGKMHNIPILFLRNIASDLRKSGLITATEGKSGGYKLTKSPDKIQIGEVIRVLSKKPIFSCCQNTVKW